MPEILAPVGGTEHLRAAVFSGADAVYLGTKCFNARQNAQNFDKQDLAQAVRFAHSRGVKVYVTLNTLVCDDEIHSLVSEIKNIALAGVDALIVQDLAVVKFAKDICPEMELHASTQMAVHNEEGVQALAEMGFKRVVLARELSFEEIERIKKACPDTELEIFVHGALCMSVSGSCYLSSVIGERSGNRGLCAQPCRLNFIAKGREYALSLKDMCHIKYLQSLSDIGVKSFKIEGRMKRPEYVAASVNACVKALKGENYDEDMLRSVFSRSGFTDGYLKGKRNLNMFGYRTKEDVVSANPVLKKLQGLYKAEFPHIALDMHFYLDANKTVLTAICEGKKYTLNGATAVCSVDHAITEEAVKRNLSKTGGTPFYVENISCEITENLMLPYSEINRMRRELIENILEDMSKILPYYINDVKPEINTAKHIRKADKLYGIFPTSDLVCAEEYFDKIILPVEEIAKDLSLIEKYSTKLVGYVPSLVFPENADKIRSKLVSLKESGLNEVLCDNIGFLHFCKRLGFTLHGGYGLNITNSTALKEYEKIGLSDVVMSFELSAKRISRIKADIPIGVIGYGHLPLMKLRACPLRGEKGCGACKGSGTLTDRMGNVFTVSCNEAPHNYSVLYNHLPLYIADKGVDFADFTVMYFTKESKENIRKIVNAFVSGQACNFEKTNGLYFRNLK